MSIFEEQQYTKNFDFGLWKRLARFLLPHKRTVAWLMLTVTIVGAVDISWPLLTRHAIDNIIIPANSDGLFGFSMFMLVTVLTQAVMVYLFIKLAARLETGLPYDIRAAAFKHLQKLAVNYYTKKPVGWLMSRLTSDTNRLGEIISWGVVDIVWAVMVMTGVGVVMFWLNWRLALITLTVIPPLAIISVWFQRRILGSQRLVRKTNSKITAAFNECIMGARTTKTLAREHNALGEFAQLSGVMRRDSVRTAVFSSLYFPILLSLASVGTGLALWLGSKSNLSGALSYGTLVAFVGYAVEFFQPIHHIAYKMAEMQLAQASGERIFSLLEEPLEIVDTEQALAKVGNEPGIKGEVEFKDVNFCYQPGQWVLQNFNLKIQVGQTVALVGHTGSGKSTLVNLACRFYEPTSGSILIDGLDYREHTQHWLHSRLGYVLQTPHLFSGTVADNIRYGRLDATAEEIEEAARLVNAHQFIIKLENGYNTQVGEGGDLLSTGQKQLISLARAFVAHPSLFVLDEATSSVDTKTEVLIQQAIENVQQNRTSFIVAHRLSTIKHADLIVVLDNGKIVEQGSHAQLIKLRGRYWALYTEQFKTEEENKLLSA